MSGGLLAGCAAGALVDWRTARAYRPAMLAAVEPGALGSAGPGGTGESGTDEVSAGVEVSSGVEPAVPDDAVGTLASEGAAFGGKRRGEAAGHRLGRASRGPMPPGIASTDGPQFLDALLGHLGLGGVGVFADDFVIIDEGGARVGAAVS